MVIDAHVHVWDRTWQPEWLWQFFRKVRDFGDGMSEKDFETKFLPSFVDPTGERLIAEMDRAGVKKSIMLAIDWGLVDPTDVPVLTPREHNRAHAAICETYPDRLMFGMGVDPRRPDAIQILEEGVRDLGAKCVKLYPPAGFYPNDRAFYRFYEKCAELGVPLQPHTGPVGVHTLRLKYSHPMHWNDVAVDFPELTIILAHTGLHWWRDCLGVAALFENVITDLSWFANIVHPEVYGLEGAYRHERDLGKPPQPHPFWDHVREILTILPGRIMYGSDYNGLQGVQEAHVRLYKRMREAKDLYGIEFSNDEVDDFLWRTANRVYGLGLSAADMDSEAGANEEGRRTPEGIERPRQ